MKRAPIRMNQTIDSGKRHFGKNPYMVHSLCKDKSFKIPIPNSGFRLMSTQFGEIWRCFDFRLHFVDCILESSGSLQLSVVTRWCSKSYWMPKRIQWPKQSKWGPRWWWHAGSDGSVGKGDGVMGVMLMVGWSAGLRLVDVLMLVEVGSSSARWSGNTWEQMDIY